MEQRVVNVNGVKLANNSPFGLLCGPCQIESRQHAIDIAGAMIEITKELNIPYIFKASFDKANRTSIHGARGVGLEEGMRTFDDIEKHTNNILQLRSQLGKAIAKLFNVNTEEFKTGFILDTIS